MVSFARSRVSWRSQNTSATASGSTVEPAGAVDGHVDVPEPSLDGRDRPGELLVAGHERRGLDVRQGGDQLIHALLAAGDQGDPVALAAETAGEGQAGGGPGSEMATVRTVLPIS